MNNFKKYSNLTKFLTISFFSSLILASLVFAQAQNEPDPTTIKCASHLFGTMSKDDCAKTCKTGTDTCKLMTKVNGAAGGEVTDCYVCPYDLSCHEIGADDWLDCFKCDMNPLTECIKAGWMPPGGFPGAPGGDPIGGKTPGGTQCYKCVNKVDKCLAPSTWFKSCMTTCALPKQCVLSGKDVNGIDCYTCKDNKADTCNDLGMLSNADCAACNAKPNMQCVPGGFTKMFQPCFKCVAKQKPPVPDTCYDYGMEANCNPCIAKDMGCNFIKVDDQLTCAWCYDKKKEPKSQCQPPDFDSSGCKACEKDGGVCIGRTHARGEPDCYYCYKKNVPPPPTGCDEYHLPNSCNPNPCSENEDCQMTTMSHDLECAECISRGAETCAAMKLLPDCHQCYNVHLGCKATFVPSIGANCYECYRPREAQTCEEMGWASDCEPNPCHEGQVCTPYEVKKDFYCATCTNQDDVQCPEGTMKGRCSETSCPSYQNCYSEYGCYECYDKTCRDFDMVEDCKVCEELGKDCKNVSPHPNFNCHQCVDKGLSCPVGSLPGGCSSESCGSGDICIPGGEDCHRCEKKIVEETPPVKSCNSGMFPGTCPGVCADKGLGCTPSGLGDGCYYCTGKETFVQPCSEGSYLGMCPGSCSPNEQCNIDFGNPRCYTCSPKKRCADYDLYEDCIACGWRGEDCVDKSPALGVECKECKPNPCHPHLTKEECKRCDWEDADCSPVDKNGRFYPTGATVDKGSGPQCYECDYGERCGDYGLVCNCFACRPGTLCVPSDRLYDGKQCYACVKNATVSVQYVIIIIETPYARYVLDKNKTLPSELGDFVPRKVMALAKLEEVNGIKQVAGFLKGGMNAANMVPVNMESLTSALQGSLSSGGKFTENCFKDFQAADFQEKLPAGSEIDHKKDKKKKDEEPAVQVSQGYGEDPLANVTLTGPVFACGESSGKKALMVLDAGGNPTGLITQDIAKKSPDALKAAIQKAQSASETFLELKRGGWQGMVKKFIGSLIDRGASEVKEIGKDKKKKKKGELDVEVDPNDPLYAKPEKGKKKKFLGILGGDAPSTPVVTGTIMRFGGQVLGAGAGADANKKEPKIDYQWGLYKIGFTPKSDPQSAWNTVDADDKNVIVAVVDSGLDLTHPDGPRYIWKNPGEIPDNKIDDDSNGYVDDVNGWSFLDNNNDLRDFKGHGTFVAGIIAARLNNGQGIAGINPGAVIMPLKVANEEGEASSFNIYRAIHYAVSHGAKVINVSLGSHGISLMEQAAINYAREMKVFVSIASGNVGENIGDHGPASALGAFSVGAIDISGERSTISNWGGNNGLLAPAEEIYSLLSVDAADRFLPALRKLGYHTESGTSFSSPMVAATASLILVKHPNYTPADIEDVLQRSATDMYEEGWDGKSGAGLLNAAAALRDEVQSKLTVKLNALKKNVDDNKQFDSIDVTATVRGDLDQFTVGVGRGIHPGSFKTIAGPFKMEADNDWVARIRDSEMRGSTDWVVRIEATDRMGKKYVAESAVDLKN